MTKKKVFESQDVFFEIGTEELPATNLADIFSAGGGSAFGGETSEGVNVLEVKLKQSLADNRLAYGACRVWATPRRLVFIVESIAPEQAAKENLIKLIPKSEAYDASGQPAEKLLNILKHRKADVKDVIVSDLNGKDYAFLKNAESVQKTAAVLPQVFETLAKTLGFPKNMRWDNSGLVFPRPIRSAICFYGSKSIGVKVGSLKSGNEVVLFSRGKRSRVKVSDAASYFKTLEKSGVILEPSARKQKIRQTLDKLAKDSNGRLYDDPFLMSEVNFLVENPNGLAAPFGEEFLKLPLEVLTVSMARKQRIFGLLGKDGKVLPRFLAIVDGKISAAEQKTISKNYEHILHAKLQDSLFFYKEDLKVSLEAKRKELKNLVFLKGAGSMLEKTERLAGLAKKISGDLNLSPTDAKALERASALSKSDLLTLMVGEFPELQGVIGKYYALENGEPAEVAQAIGEQYLPRTAGDRLPSSTAGSVLSMLDKIDLIAACYRLGLEPTSSMDPYGLRRSGIAVIKIALDRKLDFPIASVVEQVMKLQKIDQPKLDEKTVLQKLCGENGFFWDRFKAVAAGPDTAGDLVDAVVGAKRESFLEVYQRVKALSDVAGATSFQQAAKVVERTSNILKGKEKDLPDTVNPATFTEALEGEVFKKYQESHMAIQIAKQSRDFRLATNLYAGAFFAILGEFFEKVFINAEDLGVRKNRLALLKVIKDLYAKDIADLSKIRPK